MAENEQEDAEAWRASSPVDPTQLASLPNIAQALRNRKVAPPRDKE